MSKLTRENAGKAIRAARLAAELTQEEAAARAGVRQSDWSQFERGRGVSLFGSLPKIAKALGLTPEDLVAASQH